MSLVKQKEALKTGCSLQKFSYIFIFLKKLCYCTPSVDKWIKKMSKTFVWHHNCNLSFCHAWHTFLLLVCSMELTDSTSCSTPNAIDINTQNMSKQYLRFQLHMQGESCYKPRVTTKTRQRRITHRISQSMEEGWAILTRKKDTFVTRYS